MLQEDAVFRDEIRGVNRQNNARPLANIIQGKERYAIAYVVAIAAKMLYCNTTKEVRCFTMLFREIDSPSSASFVEFPGSIKSLPVMPPAQLFVREMTYWRDRQEEADRAGDPFVRAVAQQIQHGFDSVLAAHRMVAIAIHRQVGVGAVRDWMARAVLVTSHARMMREINPASGEAGRPQLSFNAAVAACIDYSVYEPQKSGLHVTPDHINTNWGMEAPDAGETRFYEGQALYLQATGSPAQPTQVFLERYQAQYGQPFDAQGYVTVVPRLKADYWRTGLA